MTILQAEGNVAMLKMMVSIGRAKKAELEAAEAVLKELKGEIQPVASPIAQPITAPTPTIPTNYTPLPVPTAHPVSPDFIETIFQRKADLMTDIKKLTSEQNELSNRLKEVPENVECPTMTREIVKLRKRIELLWTDYRFIDRNGQLPEHKKIEENANDDPDKDIQLLRISQDLKRLRDQRLKLQKKLEKPHLHTKFEAVKVPEWQTELIQVQEAIAELEYQKELIG